MAAATTGERLRPRLTPLSPRPAPSRPIATTRFQYFGGIKGGYAHGGDEAPSVSTLGDDAKNWHHYAMTWDGTTEKIYVDGVSVSELPRAATDENTQWWKEKVYIFVGGSAYNDR